MLLTAYGVCLGWSIQARCLYTHECRVPARVAFTAVLVSKAYSQCGAWSSWTGSSLATYSSPPLSTASVTYGQPWSKNIKWKTPEINNS